MLASPAVLQHSWKGAEIHEIHTPGPPAAQYLFSASIRWRSMRPCASRCTGSGCGPPRTRPSASARKVDLSLTPSSSSRLLVAHSLIACSDSTGTYNSLPPPECGKCGDEFGSVFTYAAGSWGPDAIRPLQFMPRALVSQNSWTVIPRPGFLNFYFRTHDASLHCLAPRR